MVDKSVPVLGGEAAASRDHPTDRVESADASSVSRGEIVAIIEEPASAERCLTVAQRAARLAGSMSLSALHISVDPAKLIADAEEIDLQQMREFREGPARDRLAQSRRVFESWAARCGAEVRWLEHVGDVASSLAAEVKGAALIAIAQPHNLDSADALHAAIFDTGRPVLFVPTEGALPEALGEHMVVAWKPRAQARRAVTWTMPWLSAAKRLTIVTVEESQASQDCAEVLSLLSERGLSADVRHVRKAHGEHIAARLLGEAEALEADSIVMGAFRFGQIFEWVFGGVTSEVLHRTRLPVFMMH